MPTKQISKKRRRWGGHGRVLPEEIGRRSAASSRSFARLIAAGLVALAAALFLPPEAGAQKSFGFDEKEKEAAHAEVQRLFGEWLQAGDQMSQVLCDPSATDATRAQATKAYDLVKKKLDDAIAREANQDAVAVQAALNLFAAQMSNDLRAVQKAEKNLKAARQAAIDAIWSRLGRPATVGMRPWRGFYAGLEIVKNAGRVKTREFLATNGDLTNEFTDSGDPLGVGVAVGYYFSPFGSVVVGPFASFDFLRQTINRTFAGGTFLGTTTHWIATAGGRLGVNAAGILVYGLAGASFLNHDLNINFGGPVTSQNTTTPGFTAGIGGEFQLSALQRSLGVPVSVFVQYQHTWWQDAHLDTPAASPRFNYAFRREDDTVKLGLNFYLAAPTPLSPRPALITK
jgi:hypothetical protein